MGGYVKGVILVVVILFFITFGVENSQHVQVKYYLNTLTINFPLYGVVYVSIIIGIIIGMIVGFRSRLHMRKTIKNLQKENRELIEGVTEEDGDQREAV